MERRRLTVTHWGAYDVTADGGRVTNVTPFPRDPDPSPIGRSLQAADECRVARPSVRRSWLEGGPGSGNERRGVDPFVEVEWDQALDLVAGELGRVRSRYGNQAIYGGSYGWSSAGRFHHAQSQVHRFLASIGGYTRSVNTYSFAAAEVLVPHVLGTNLWAAHEAHTSWPVMAHHTELFVTFGGMPRRNSQVQNGGHGRHRLREAMREAHRRGARFVNVSPIRDDVLDEVRSSWIPVRPNTDVAVMLGLAHSIVTSGRHDLGFLQTHCSGWEQLERYLLGRDDGVPKSTEWAAELAGIEPATLRELAAEMTERRTMLNVSWSLQRADHGEQTYWMVIALAAIVGQIGLPGGGFGLGYGTTGTVGNGVKRRPFPSLPKLPNPVDAFIPVARIADLLLEPGGTFTYDGGTHTYPEIHLVYWAGGNPFHHHQDLNRLLRAWRVPDTIVVHEPFWTASARHADVVLPATTPLEREDVGGAPTDDHLFAMQPVLEPVGEARDDYDIFAALATRLGSGAEFTEGRTTGQWLEHLYATYRTQYPDLPPYEEFVAGGFLQHRPEPHETGHLRVYLDGFRADPLGQPLATPSGRIELSSPTIGSFGYPDCPGHPQWFPPAEWLGEAGRYPLHLLTTQPARRLHSQYDHGVTSREGKVAGREPLRIDPAAAGERGIRDGDVVRVFNDRGECLAGAVIDDGLRPGVVQLATGAWYDPEVPGVIGTRCVHGNPNVLTRDVGTSSLGQGPTAQTCLVEVAPFEGEPPEVTAHRPPRFASALAAPPGST